MVSASPAAFTGVFTQQEPIEDQAIAAAVAVLKSGRLHRYNTLGDALSEAALLEQEYAAYQGSTYCLALASGGYALQTAMRAIGVGPGVKVMTNAFTLSPVPGAVAAVNGLPVLVECTTDLVIDLEDLQAKIASSGARVLLLSLMRGHLPDMDRLSEICRAAGVTLIEDCAHTMGASWNGRMSGNFGIAGCFSTQTYKHINSGEGGLLTSDDPDFMARAILLSGSYMLYESHAAAPPVEAFEHARLKTPNCSGRMDNLRAAILRPQLATLDANIARWNARYRVLEAGLRKSSRVLLRSRPAKEHFVGSSIQFRIPDLSDDQVAAFIASTKALGVALKWFGDDNPVGFTSNHTSWRYMPSQDLPQTDRVLRGLFDLRIPLTFSEEDCAQIAAIITHCADGLLACSAEE